MEGAARLRSQVVPVRRHFQGSRLEPALLASAYEEAVPLLRRARRLSRDAAGDGARAAVGQQQLATTGG
jgi:hypothetical protein